jgi:hypothetical protein
MHARPVSVTVAAILLALLSLANVLFPLWAETAQPAEEIPPFIVYLTVGVGLVGLVGAAGLWMLRKWGIWLTMVVCVLNVLDAAPGVAFAPTAAWQAAATVTVVVYVLIIVLVVLPTSRRAFRSRLSFR